MTEVAGSIITVGQVIELYQARYGMKPPIDHAKIEEYIEHCFEHGKPSALAAVLQIRLGTM